jgi:hypothetical protein
MFFGAGWFLLQASHLGTLAAVGLVACAGLTMMRQEERSLRTIIVVMVNTPLRSGMVLKIGMEGSDLRHLLLLRSGTELPRGICVVNACRFFLPGGTSERAPPGRPYSAWTPALARGCSCTAGFLPEEAFFDFRINRVKPLLSALCSVPMLLGFSL